MCKHFSTDIGIIFCMDTMTLLLQRLKALTGREIVALSATSGVPYNTLLNLRKGITLDPRISTVEAINYGLGKLGK